MKRYSRIAKKAQIKVIEEAVRSNAPVDHPLLYAVILRYSAASTINRSGIHDKRHSGSPAV
jgi:hypothetical protein